MDAYRERWTQAFATACKAPRDPAPRDSERALPRARDQAAARALILH